MIILGIDVGFAITGWSILEKASSSGPVKDQLLAYGAITTKAKTPLPERLEIIYNELDQIIKEFNPNNIAIESLFYFKNQKTVISVAQARGVMLLVGQKNAIPVFDYTPLQVKTAVTGYGRASKEQIQKMVKLLYNLESIPKPDDIADAIAVATCHSNSIRYTTY